MAATPSRQEHDGNASREWVGNGANGGRSSTAPGDIEQVARALGWFSIGLGLAQLAAPRRVAQMIGLPGEEDDQNVMRVVGVREIASGLGILAQAKPTPGLWLRVGGDVMDLALLRSAMDSPRTDTGRITAATLAVLGITAADLISSAMMTAEPAEPYDALQARDVEVTAAVTVQAPRAEVFAIWDGFQGLPRFMSDAASVQLTGEGQSRWSMAGPAGTTLEWDIQITDSRPNEQIAWSTADGSAMSAQGAVRFRDAPGNRGTQVIFDAHFRPPGGELGKKLAAPFAETMRAKLGSDLRHFKQLVELGEIVYSDDSIVPGPNPAQPRPEIPAGLAQSGAA